MGVHERVRRPFVAALGLFVVTASCHREPRSDHALEVVVPTPPTSWDPRFSTDAVGLRVSRLLHAGLVSLDPDTLLPRPAAAESLALDGLTITITLRPGVRFASGAPLEADDVCATLSAVASATLGSPHRQVLAAFARCVVDSPTALRVELSHARASWQTDLELPILRRDEVTRVAPGGALDGLGPYVLAGGDAGGLELRPSPHGVGAVAHRPLVVRTIRDENARTLRVLSGSADVVPNALSPTSLRALEHEGVRVVRRPGANLTYLATNDETGPTRALKVRQAIAAALDRERLARTVLEGGASVAETFLPPSSFAWRPPSSPIRHDRAAASRVLQGVHLSLLVSSDRTRGLLARAIAQDLEDAGARIEVIPLELGVMLSRLTAGDFELSVLQIPELTEPHVLSWFFRSSAIPGVGQGANRARYRSPALDALLDEGGRVSELDARRRIYAGVLDVLEADLPVIPLFHEDQIAAVSARAVGFVPSAEGRWGALAGL